MELTFVIYSVGVFQWDIFGSGGLLAVNTACCKAPEFGKLVCYLANSQVKEGPSNTSGEVWGENRSLFGASKSIFQGCVDFAYLSEASGNCYILKIYLFFFIVFILNPTQPSTLASMSWELSLNWRFVFLKIGILLNLLQIFSICQYCIEHLVLGNG